MAAAGWKSVAAGLSVFVEFSQMGNGFVLYSRRIATWQGTLNEVTPYEGCMSSCIFLH